ncbi:MAG: histidine kinase [Tannerella sp.]|nr:histidine kinase [Tannerella sp.]
MTNLKISSFGYYDGFDLLECGQNGASIDDEGYVWVAGGEKVIRFLPEQLMQKNELPPAEPFPAGIYFLDNNLEWSSMPPDSIPKLDNDHNFLRFDWLQASASSPNRLAFRYRLDGYNRQWTTTRERSQMFQNLPFGKYRIELQSSVDNGLQWSKSVFSPYVTIRPPFLLSLPGLILLSIGFIAFISFCIGIIRKIITRQEEEKRQIDRLKLLSLQAKFIPHFTGNVLNSINFMILKKPREAQQYISDFSDFTRMTLLNSNLLFRPLHEEIEYVKLYLKLEKLRFEEKLEFDIAVHGDIDLQMHVPCMILQTFCENALKHGLSAKPEGGVIKIEAYLNGEYVILAVEDNGVGREKARALHTEGTQEGLKIIRQQLDLFNRYKCPDGDGKQREYYMRKMRWLLRRGDYSLKADMQLIDLHDAVHSPSGTRVEVHFPI